MKVDGEIVDINIGQILGELDCGSLSFEVETYRDHGYVDFLSCNDAS